MLKNFQGKKQKKKVNTISEDNKTHMCWVHFSFRSINKRDLSMSHQMQIGLCPTPKPQRIKPSVLFFLKESHQFKVQTIFNHNICTYIIRIIIDICGVYTHFSLSIHFLAGIYYHFYIGKSLSSLMENKDSSIFY